MATREASDPHRELWWAHTGGGGGNFGVVTRYWFRSPRAPESITTFKAEWSWSDIDQPSFLRLLRNHGIWCERNNHADSPYVSLWNLLEIHRKQFGRIIVRGVSTADAAEREVADHLAALSEGIGAPNGRELARMSWLEFALNPLPDLFAAPPGGVSVKVKDALLKKRFTDRQIGVAYDYLTRTDHDVMGGMLGLATYGGRINHPDTDLADPALNTSGVPWHTLYYQDNYPRLQQIKARWDPRTVPACVGDSGGMISQKWTR